MVDVMRWTSERPPSALVLLRRRLDELGERVPPSVQRRIALAEGLTFALLPIAAVVVVGTWAQLRQASPEGDTATTAFGIGAVLLVVTSALALLFRGSLLRRAYRTAIEQTERLDGVSASGGASSSVGVPGTSSRRGP